MNIPARIAFLRMDIEMDLTEAWVLSKDGLDFKAASYRNDAKRKQLELDALINGLRL